MFVQLRNLQALYEKKKEECDACNSKVKKL